MTRLTAKQTEALQLIAANPKKVIAVDRTRPGYLKINGNVEHALRRLELIEKVQIGTGVHHRYGTPTEYPLNAWELTEAGQAALAAITG